MFNETINNLHFHIFPHIFIYTYSHIRIHTHIHTACVYKHAQNYTCTHIYTWLTHIYTYICICTYVYSSNNIRCTILRIEQCINLYTMYSTNVPIEYLITSLYKFCLYISYWSPIL